MLLLFSMWCSLHVAVNVCINCSFVHLYLLLYYSLRHFSYSGLYYFRYLRAVFIGYVIWFLTFTLRVPFASFHVFYTTTVLCSNCRSRILWRSGNIYSVLAILYMRRNGIISTSSPMSPTSTSYKSTDILAIWQRSLLRMSHFWAACYNSDNATGFSDPDFL